MVIKVGAQYLAPKDIPGLKIYPSTASPSTYLTASDFTDFKMKTMGTYNLLTSWSSTKLTSDAWTGSLSVESYGMGTARHLMALVVKDPTYAKASFRYPWNEFTYVGSGVITPLAASKFNSPYFDVDP